MEGTPDEDDDNNLPSLVVFVIGNTSRSSFRPRTDQTEYGKIGPELARVFLSNQP
jgi:hypothetical protein